jgi:chaperonin GroEL
MKAENGFPWEEKLGANLIKRALEEPVRQISQNAASVAGLLMTTEAMVAEKPKKDKSSAPTMPPEDMY